MNPRLVKETRFLLPAFGVTVLATLATSLIWRGYSALGALVVVFTVCCTLMGASSFGNEFQYQTMPLLLSQPLSRRSIWFEKMLVLGVAVALAFAALLLCVHYFPGKESIEGWSGDPALGLLFFSGVALIPLGVFCTAPYWALIGKNTVMATVFSFVGPMVIWLVLMFLGWLFSLEASFEEHPFLYTIIPAAIYCGVLYRLGYAAFMRFQAVDSQAQEISLPAGLEAALARPVNKLIPGFTGPLASLIRKELQLQRASYLIAGLACVVALVEALIWELHHSEVTLVLMMMDVVLCVLIIPLITAGVSVAEERNLGVSGWQLALPPSALKQWTAKLWTVLATCALLGIVLPLIMVMAGNWVLLHEPIHFGAPDNWQTLLPHLDFVLGYLLLLGIGIFASSISTNSFRAILLFFGLLAAAGCWIGLVSYSAANVVRSLQESGSLNSYLPIGQLKLWSMRHQITGNDLDWITMIALVPLLALPAGLAHFLAFSNYRNGELIARRRWIHASVIVAAITGLALLMLAFEFLLAASVGRS